ncbi:MAG: rRNA maturation RNase YbeY [Treponema sp.]|jgi:probable rRNA maturation factor|nr:rRNA maturation RNase YbeY [Treponema sp.]
MSNRVLITVEENYSRPSWLDKVEPFVLQVLSALDYDREEISLLFCSDVFMKNLNSTYRHIAASTDVLSFENGDSYTDEDGQEWKSAGDIAISVDMLPVNAEKFDTTVDEELKRLLIHGILHIHGMDHGAEHIEKGVDPVCDMLVLQEKLLQQIAGKII